VTDRVFEEFRTYYALHCSDTTAPYAGIRKLLTELQGAGIRSAIVSNKADFATKDLARKHFGDLVDFAMGAREDIPKKPAPDMIACALAEMHVSPAEAVYIGDSEVDVETAENAGTDVVCVTWGFRDKDFLVASGAKKFVDSASELLSLLIRE
jgi:phosphoglycolate phosphatase